MFGKLLGNRPRKTKINSRLKMSGQYSEYECLLLGSVDEKIFEGTQRINEQYKSMEKLRTIPIGCEQINLNDIIQGLSEDEKLILSFLVVHAEDNPTYKEISDQVDADNMDLPLYSPNILKNLTPSRDTNDTSDRVRSILESGPIFRT